MDCCQYSSKVFTPFTPGIATAGDRALAIVILIISELLLSQEQFGVGMASARLC